MEETTKQEAISVKGQKGYMVSCNFATIWFPTMAKATAFVQAMEAGVLTDYNWVDKYDYMYWLKELSFDIKYGQLYTKEEVEEAKRLAQEAKDAQASKEA
jgi:hypothetical protein